MAITVDVQENPKVSKVGKPVSDCVVISSGLSTELVRYNIRSKDRQEDFIVGTNMNTLTMPQVVTLSTGTLKIMLSFRRWYEVRVKGDSGAWSAWKEFKTRDKTYVTPVAIYTARAAFDETPAKRGNRRLVITNVGKTEARTDARPLTAGRPVYINSDHWFNDTESITATNAGARIVNSYYDNG